LSAKHVSLVFAAESGSRAWGFPSPDSDYDIRFIFAKRTQDYLSLQDDVQDIAYTKGDRDYAGWDVRKALLLAAKSNPSLIEWLGSPIIYADPIGFRADLLALVAEHFSPKALAHHYINFMRNIRGKHIADFMGEFTLKRYFYALRPILCIMWMEKHPYQLPPVVFQHLLALDLDASLVAEIDTLLRLKAETREDYEYSSPLLDDFIRSWYEQGHARASAFPVRSMPMALLNDVFRQTIQLLDPLS
jgi:predicted nucleotidyltransferase